MWARQYGENREPSVTLRHWQSAPFRPNSRYSIRRLAELVLNRHNFDRVARSLGTREQMSARIAALDEEIAALDAEIKSITPSVNYGDLGDLVADRMNDYLNSLNADRLSKWKTGRVSVKLRRDDLDIMLDEQLWTAKAGGTAQYIVQLAYHYALFSLTKDGHYNYPGLLIIDFPPHFAKAANLRDSETYLLEPFVKLCALPEMKGAQVIIAGRAFDNLAGANFIACSASTHPQLSKRGRRRRDVRG